MYQWKGCSHSSNASKVGCYCQKQDADWMALLGTATPVFPSPTEGEIFCLISALLFPAGCKENGGTASRRAGTYKTACVGWMVPCSPAQKSMWGCACVCGGGNTSGKQRTCPNKQKAKTSPSSAPWETPEQILPVAAGPFWESHG